MMNNENGRSMVEMLGVLAIIGVLSVAGIAGYSMAMKKYKTNEILNTASQLVVMATAQKASGGANTYSSSSTGFPAPSGYETMTANCANNLCEVSTNGTKDEAWNKAVEATASSSYYKVMS